MLVVNKRQNISTYNIRHKSMMKICDKLTNFILQYGPYEQNI